jgi:hypothetical protein
LNKGIAVGGDISLQSLRTLEGLQTLVRFEELDVEVGEIPDA